MVNTKRKRLLKFVSAAFIFMPAMTYSPTTFACSTIGPAGLNLRRLAGVSEAGARRRNPGRLVRRILTSVFATGRSRLRRHFDLCITARPRQIHSFHDEPNMGAKSWPLLLAQDHH